MKTLLSDDLWTELATRSLGHKRIRAAISYVTAKHLEFHGGDQLVCDASDDAIKGGLTSASTLRTFVDQGAEVYSYDGLHAKAAVIDDLALIGSANLSENAGIHTLEASLLTDDAQVLGLIHGFIEKVTAEADLVDEEFLRRIEVLPVVRRHSIPRKNTKKIDVGQSKVWLISTRELSEKLAKAEEDFDLSGKAMAQKKILNSNHEPRSIRWSGKSKFRAEAKAGDLIIEIYTDRRGKSKRKFVEVYAAAPIRLRYDEGVWTRFYLEIHPEREFYYWNYVHKYFKSMGISNITSSSTRELTGKALGILQLLK